MTTTYDGLLGDLRDHGLDPGAVMAAIDAALEEDLPGDAVDVTSVATIPADATGEGVFAAREPGVVAGLGVAALVFLRVDAGVEIADRVPDATPVADGDVVMRVSGREPPVMVPRLTGVVAVGEVLAPVGAAGLLPQRGGVGQRRGDREQVGGLPGLLARDVGAGPGELVEEQRGLRQPLRGAEHADA